MDAAGELNFGIAACAAAAAADIMDAGAAAATGFDEPGELVAGVPPLGIVAPLVFAFAVVPEPPVVLEAELANCCRV